MVETFTRNLRMTTSVYLRRCKNDTFEKVLKVDKISRDICSFGKKCEFSEIISTNVIKVKKPILLFVIFQLITATNHGERRTKIERAACQVVTKCVDFLDFSFFCSSPRVEI